MQSNPTCMAHTARPWSSKINVVLLIGTVHFLLLAICGRHHGCLKCIVIRELIDTPMHLFTNMHHGYDIDDDVVFGEEDREAQALHGVCCRVCFCHRHVIYWIKIKERYKVWEVYYLHAFPWLLWWTSTLALQRCNLHRIYFLLLRMMHHVILGRHTIVNG